ncbi:hypothetical protein PPYR_11327 [Photinus pyralis]|uniref:Uncharacterized protein n=3 Tax=Photinus pyralis TaxID=7054 RepID=A0A5N4AB52_PHOPY|nr:uncharacterized protein LOC116177420 [Photinus pyralis]XP_031352253.1 uncharacterized protein LOC116177420 [Photinus pyralis]XP_031352255.1 uncharacterized protein LOC116177420 [Photinus pyralis]KAB0794488.1 hypothetical protein PPYR_11327 [Photinus pyralis]
MGSLWKHIRSWCMIRILILIHLPHLIQTCVIEMSKLSPLDRELKTYVDDLVKTDSYKIFPGVDIKRNFNVTQDELRSESCRRSREMRSIDDYLKAKLEKYALNHYVRVNLPETARFFQPVEAGKSSFMAGFGMGFLAFALKKMLLPVFIGAQLIKSVLLALFLPSLLGSVGKLLGKGLSTFSGSSGSSGLGHGNNDPVEDFEFKDTSPYNVNSAPDTGTAETGLSINVATSTDKTDTINRFGYGNNMVSYTPYQSESNYYLKKPSVNTDFKVFHKIPPSSLLLTTYDPFYSPLLSRLDAVFQQLGLGNDKSPKTERCREKLVCMMYANPAKYAPYSNLVSAQLSRELNELRKPSSDNPEILRFFRYMKAAKDGQDGEECLAHSGCPSLSADQPNPAIVTTFNEINKLVQARKFN